MKINFEPIFTRSKEQKRNKLKLGQQIIYTEPLAAIE